MEEVYEDDILTPHGRNATRKYFDYGMLAIGVTCAAALVTKVVYDVAVRHDYTILHDYWSAANYGVLLFLSGLLTYGELREMRRASRAIKR